MSHTDFLAEIQAEPAAAERRLVYADWLEERGDERGTYLRVEHTLGTTSPFVPRYWELKEQRRELRDGCEPDWLEAVGNPRYFTPLFTRLPDDRQARWRLVDRFIDFWHEPLTAESGNTEDEVAATEVQLGMRLPTSMREWYRLAGRRTGIWSKQDVLLSLDELADGQSDRGGLTFRVENQNCERWGIRAADADEFDPPVHRVLEHPTMQAATVTEFAIQTLLLETLWVSAYGGHLIEPTESDLDVIRSAMGRVDVSSTYWCLDVTMYEGRDLLLVHSEGDSYLYVAARSESAMSRLPQTMLDSLESWQ